LKKLVATACAVMALAVPAAPAAAADGSDAWWGRKPCQWGEIGTIIWHDTPATEYEEIDLCVPRIYPDDTKAIDGPARAGVTFCGAFGHYIVWYYDLDGNYHEPWNSCI
jgi:hypothetical protein